MFDDLETNLRYLNNPDFIFKVGNVADQMSVHPLRAAWPDFIPSPEKLREMVTAFTATVNAAANGDRQKIQERKEMRSKVEQSVAVIGNFIMMKSIHDSDPNLLLNTGFELKHKSYNRSPAISQVLPPSLNLKHGPVSGMIIVKAAKVLGAVGYEVEITEGEPDETSWRSLGHHASLKRLEVNNLEPASKCYFRVRCLGSTGLGPWSGPVSIIVL